MTEEALRRKLERAKQKISILEGMIEHKTRELFEEKERFRHANEYLKGIMDSMPSGVLVTDSELQIVIANDDAASLFSKSENGLEGVAIQDVLPLATFLEQLDVQTIESLHGNTVEWQCGSGELGPSIPVLLSFSVLKEGEVLDGLIVIAQDVSSRKQLEQQLMQAQRLESVGQLAAGIAHEINTPIQYVRDNTLFFKEEFAAVCELVEVYRKAVRTSELESVAGLQEAVKKSEESADLDYLLEEIPRALEQTLEGAESIARIVRSMKSFAHPGNESMQAIDINELLESAIDVSRNEWKYVAEVVREFAPDIPQVPCFPGELGQVFLNLVVNAAHAIQDSRSDGGQLGRIHVRSLVTDSHCIIEVQDSGTGIPEEVQPRIFDPFFTTKVVGKGTGQGLSLAYASIVEKHKGSLTFETQEGEGTTFQIRLNLK